MGRLLRSPFILLLFIFTTVFFSMPVSDAEAQAVTEISDPGVSWEIAGRARNGKTGWELGVVDFVPSFSNPAWTDLSNTDPYWPYGQWLDFQFTYTVSTGNIWIGVDHNQDGSITNGSGGTKNEIITYSFSEFAGHGFNYIKLRLAGNSISDANIQNWNINGTSFSNRGSGGSQPEWYFDLGTAPTDISITGQVQFRANGDQQERPSMEFKLGAIEMCAPTGTPENVCNGLDDDCDGFIDEDYAPILTTCGIGQCAGNTGQLECQGGNEIDTCNPLLGADSELCDGLDNNCDGSVDEGLTQPTICGIGVCAGNMGTETCTAGIWGNDTCDPDEGAAADDSACNGLDDDCDGLIDEDYIVDDTCGTGICQANNTPSSCTGGIETQCQTGAPTETVEASCSDSIDNDCDGQTDSSDTDCGGICLVPPVGQEIGFRDVLYTNLIEADCRFCHENPEQFPVLDATIPDRHHLLANNIIPDPTDSPFGNPGEVYECLSCHEVDASTGEIIFIVRRDCLECHIQLPAGLTVHHRTELAQGTLPQGPDCRACHGDIIDNKDDGHYIPIYTPTQSTPKRSGGSGLPLNNRGDGAGACNYCHNDGLCPPELTPFETNMTTHHNTGFGTDSAKCNWCHDFTLPFEEQFRICENCHSRDSLHKIQTDSDGDNVINPGIEQPFYGHIGNPDDCWGCHGYGASSLPPDSGPVTPSISSVSASVLPEGTDSTISLSGAAFTNMNEGTELTSNIVMIAPDGSSISLFPEFISQDSITVTIPGTLQKGNYKLKTAKINKHSNPRVISVTPDVAITDVKCNNWRGMLIIRGSGFGEKYEGTDLYLNVEVNGKVADIVSWSNNRIKVSVTSCPDNVNVTVNALFGTASTGNNNPVKPDKGR